MSWHLSHRLTNIHRAVSVALVCSISSVALLSVAHAATIGHANITSAQHEPLAASISVSNINAQDFQANIASSAVYQQMGLTPTASMSVRFVPTSATTGQLLINTSQPVSMPFADVVLAINDDGQRNLIPKTLLMPLGNSVPIKKSNRMITGATKPSLPEVSPSTAKPLVVKREAPPPLLFDQSISQTPVQTPNHLPKTTATKSLASMTDHASSLPSTALPSSEMASLTVKTAQPTESTETLNNDLSGTESVNTSNVVSETATYSPDPSSTAKTSLETESSSTLASAVSADNKQLDVLSIQVTRQIQAKKQPNAKNNIKNNTKNNETVIQNQPAPVMTHTEDDKPTAAYESTVDQSTVDDAALATQQQTPPSYNSGSDAITSIASAPPVSTYTVQRNDNLWLISQQIAQQNNLDVSLVMAQIKEQNPDAFIARDADLLKKDAQLILPKYDVIPSQQSLQTAIAAQRQFYVQKSRAQKTKAHRQKKPTSSADSEAPKVAAKPIPADTKASAPQTKKSERTTTTKLPQARFSILAPGRDGSADGTQTKAAAATGNGLSTDILATLKSARQRTADQAKRLAATQSTLGHYAKKLQLQNQKLAELEARLKELRNQ